MIKKLFTVFDTDRGVHILIRAWEMTELVRGHIPSVARKVNDVQGFLKCAKNLENEILRVCEYLVNKGRVRYPSDRVFAILQNYRVPKVIGYPAATSDTRINRISELIRYATQLEHLMWLGTCCNFREILRIIDKVKKFPKTRVHEKSVKN